MTTNLTKFEMNGLNITVSFSDYRDNKRTRVHVYGEDKPAIAEPLMSFRGENPEIDRAWDKYNREVIKNKRALVAKADLEMLRDVKLRFSRKAGCSCSCSPGFIAEHHVYLDGRRVDSIWVEAPKAE